MLDLDACFDAAREGLTHSMDLSMPIPMGYELYPIIAYFDYWQIARKPQLGEPEFLIFINARTATEVGAEQIVMSEWGLSRAKDPYNAGTRWSARGLSAHDIAGMQEAFERARLHIFPQFFRGVTSLETQTERLMAAELADRWEDMAEGGFMKYYRAFGKEWFNWLASVRAKK